MSQNILRIISITAIILCYRTLSFADEREMTASALKAMGAPNNPTVEIAWNRYYDWKQIGDICQRLAAAHPNTIHIGSIGKSVEGRELFLLTVTDFTSGVDDKKPAMYIDGNIHSNEIQGAEVALYTAWYLAENQSAIPWITALLQQRTFYIVPTINPDARDFFIHHPNTPHSPRTGMLPRDDDGDGLIDEDGFDDLDGDGNIVLMRRSDPNGRWKQDSDDPRLMIQAKPDETGAYTIIDWEGIDNDGDGQVNEDGPGYYDANRNWGWNWQPSYVQDGADQYPFSIPENRAVADFIMHHPNIGAAQSYHNAGGLLVRGPGSQSDLATYHADDVRCYDFLAKLGEEMLPDYRYVVLYKDMYEVYGGELEWFYGANGIFTFTNELWTSFDYFRKPGDEAGNWFGAQKEVYRFDKLLLFEEGIVPWKKIHHPQFGNIEIGGPKKNWTRTAPSFLIEDMCHRNMAFTLFHAYHLPCISIDSVHVEKLAADTYTLDVIVRNSRVLPTRTAHEVANRISPPDYLTISGKKLNVLAGMLVDDVDLNKTTEQRYQPEQLAVSSIPGMSTVRARWIFSGALPVTVTVNAARGGIIKKEIAVGNIR
jgi:hypothetical protein